MLRENYQQSLASFCNALQVADEYDLIWQKAWAISGVGACLEQLGNYCEANQKFAEALELLNRINDPVLIARIQIGMNRLLWRAGNQQQARLKIQETIRRLEERNQSREKALLLRDLGKFFLKLGETNLAREYLQSGLEIFTLHTNEYEARKIEAIIGETA
jgi:tetratricopeptide (TPR) repeat protein